MTCAGLFRVVIPDKGGPDTFMLQNVEWKGMHIAIKSHKVQAVSLHVYMYMPLTHARIHVLPDAAHFSLEK